MYLRYQEFQVIKFELLRFNCKNIVECIQIGVDHGYL